MPVKQSKVYLEKPWRKSAGDQSRIRHFPSGTGSLRNPQEEGVHRRMGSVPKISVRPQQTPRKKS